MPSYIFEFESGYMNRVCYSVYRGREALGRVTYRGKVTDYEREISNVDPAELERQIGLLMWEFSIDRPMDPEICDAFNAFQKAKIAEAEEKHPDYQFRPWKDLKPGIWIRETGWQEAA